MTQNSGNHTVEVINTYAAGEHIVPRAVIDALLMAWPDQFSEIMKDLKFSRDHYSFSGWGMYVCVEFDGYILMEPTPIKTRDCEVEQND